MFDVVFIVEILKYVFLYGFKFLVKINKFRVYQDSQAQLEEMDFLESGDCPALLVHKATQGKMV